jgi:hypothetical protein
MQGQLLLHKLFDVKMFSNAETCYNKQQINANTKLCMRLFATLIISLLH